MNPLFHPPREPCDAVVRAMCRETIDARGDVQAIWWLTAEYEGGEPSQLVDELHVELCTPPGANGASLEFYRAFEWSSMPPNTQLRWTFTPYALLDTVRSVAELVVERGP